MESPGHKIKPEPSLSDTTISTSLADEQHQACQDILELADILRQYISELHLIIRSHPLLTSTQRGQIQDVLEIAQSELRRAKAIGKKDPSCVGLMEAAFKLGAAKKALLYQSHQLELEEVKNWKHATKAVAVAHARLRRTQVLFSCLSSIFSSPRLLDMYLRQDCKELFDALLVGTKKVQKIPIDKIEVCRKVNAAVKTVCEICDCDVHHDSKGTPGNGSADEHGTTMRSPCCGKSFHSRCLLAELKAQQTTCPYPLCEQRDWTTTDMVKIIHTQVSHLQMAMKKWDAEAKQNQMFAIAARMK
ncbi:hypothetical protein H2200_010362 [Cladophialophora chaetospira]|uniref:Uncharacterized protein n=1 Tax=Cladophialophora chaetospira TaxID=386627 RepID=A0AA39CE55_9EURO|nr:hypothetical protein H2200_010362 [Cladophialophora chaetospira]